MTQLTKIKQILDEQGYIDNFYCFENKISLRLGARIQDLEAQGYIFRTEKKGKNYFYYLLTKPYQTQNPAPRAEIKPQVLHPVAEAFMKRNREEWHPKKELNTLQEKLKWRANIHKTIKQAIYGKQNIGLAQVIVDGVDAAYVQGLDDTAQALASQKQKFGEMLEEMEKIVIPAQDKLTGTLNFREGYNACLSDIKQRMKEI